MFCYQCEQTAKGEGCTVRGVCGKDEKTAALQDLLTYALEGLGQVAVAARQDGISDLQVNRFTCEITLQHPDQRRFRSGRVSRA